jgi:hypothetical protein
MRRTHVEYVVRSTSIATEERQITSSYFRRRLHRQNLERGAADPPNAARLAPSGLLIRQTLPDLRHLEQGCPPLPDRKGVRDRQTFPRETPVLFCPTRHCARSPDIPARDAGTLLPYSPPASPSWHQIDVAVLG